MDAENRNDETVEDIVKLTINKMGYDFNSFSEKDKNYLLRIEGSIKTIFEQQEAAKCMMNENNITLVSIAESVNISRRTLYNLPVLNKYIECRAKEFKTFNTKDIINNSKSELKRLKEEIIKMKKRDIMIEKYKIEIDQLKDSLKEKEKIIAHLKKNY